MHPNDDDVSAEIDAGRALAEDWQARQLQARGLPVTTGEPETETARLQRQAAEDIDRDIAARMLGTPDGVARVYRRALGRPE